MAKGFTYSYIYVRTNGRRSTAKYNNGHADSESAALIYNIKIRFETRYASLSRSIRSIYIYARIKTIIHIYAVKREEKIPDDGVTI